MNMGKYTQLSDRQLWYDGDSVFSAANILADVKKYKVQYVDCITPLICEYNANVSKNEELKTKSCCGKLDTDWNIPDQYKTLDVTEYVANEHARRCGQCSDIEAREIRLAQELTLYEHSGLFDVLRTIIYVINILSTNRVGWGVGRGSSVSSYVLYVLGVHDIDSFAYDLDIHDFLNDEVILYDTNS